MADRIRVGIIGAGERGWAQAAHIPALRALPDYEIRAVSTTRRDSAEHCARSIGALHAFDNHHDLLALPDIDLAVIAVNVMHHHEIAIPAIAAGKMVFSEWPLGRNLAEAEEIAALARKAGVKTLIGLQGRFGPAIRYVRDLVGDGFVGKLLGSSIRGSAPHEVWAGVLDRPYEFHAEPANGATLLSIPAGHVLDMLAFVLGDFVDVSATMVARRGDVLRLRDGKRIPTTAKDPIAFAGSLENGALAAVHFHGGAAVGPDFVWEINGTAGDILVSSDGGFANMAAATVTARRAGEAPADMPIPPAYRLAPQGVAMPADNVAALYTQFAADLSNGTNLAPDFDVALRRHRLMDAIEQSDASGTRQTIDYRVAR